MLLFWQVINLHLYYISKHCLCIFWETFWFIALLKQINILKE